MKYRSMEAAYFLKELPHVQNLTVRDSLVQLGHSNASSTATPISDRCVDSIRYDHIRPHLSPPKTEGHGERTQSQSPFAQSDVHAGLS